MVYSEAMLIVFYMLPVITFLAVLALIPVARWLAVRCGFVDEPGGRKKHEGAVPPIGGLVVFPVFMLMLLFLGVSTQPATLWFFAALSLLLVTGALDDRFHVPPRIKFIMQWLAAFIIVVPGQIYVVDLGNLLGFGDIAFGKWSAYIFAIVATVLLINAINLMDGLDGLAGGFGAIFFVLMALCYALSTIYAASIVCLAFAGAIGGFLVFNMRHRWRRKASVFLGDSGSLALGLSLAYFSIESAQWGLGGQIDMGHRVTTPVTIAWILALPIYDTCGQFARRVREGRHPFDPDDNHFHHHFIHAGFSVGQATAIILMLVTCGGLIGIGGVLVGVPDYVLGWLWTVLLFAHIYMSMRPDRFQLLLSRLRERVAL